MSETVSEQVTAADAGPRTSAAWRVLTFVVAVAPIMAAVGTFEYFLRGREIREVSLPTYLFAYPALAEWIA